MVVLSGSQRTVKATTTFQNLLQSSIARNSLPKSLLTPSCEASLVGKRTRTASKKKGVKNWSERNQIKSSMKNCKVMYQWAMSRFCWKKTPVFYNERTVDWWDNFEHRYIYNGQKRFLKMQTSNRMYYNRNLQQREERINAVVQGTE